VPGYALIRDGETVRVGETAVKAVFTPGHTIGSTSYLAGGRFLAVGDLALIKKGRLAAMPKPPSEDPGTMTKSLKIVDGIEGVAYVLTGHGGILKRRATTPALPPESPPAS